jgi:dienelactone hydrolase
MSSRIAIGLAGERKRLRPLILFFVALVANLPAHAQPTIQINPSKVIEGDPVHVVVSGLRPEQAIELRATRLVAAYPTGTETYEAAASFIADHQGVLDLRSSAPLKGSSYDSPDPSGLFWSMTEKRHNDSSPHNGNLAAGDVRIVAEEGGKIIATATARVQLGSEDVTVREIREPSITGVFARNGSREPQPAIIVLGGSEGGLFTARWAAPILASHGYSVLGVGYFQGEEQTLSGLPINLASIPLEVLTRARDWLAQQPGVDASRIALVGVSKGAELALVGAATFPWVTVVGAFAPTHVVWEGIPPPDQPNRDAGSSWTFQGRPLPYVRWSRAAEERGDQIRAATGSSRLTETHWESLAEFTEDVELARIPIERSQAAVFVAAGIDDGLWPAAYSAEQLRRRLRLRLGAASSSFEIHPTGHLVMGSGWAPTTQFQRSKGRLLGGNARLDAEAQKRIWPAFLEFLATHLPSEAK